MTKNDTTPRRRARKSSTTPTTTNQPSTERELEQIDETAVEEARKVLDLIAHAPAFIQQALTAALDKEGAQLREASGDFSLIAVARAFERRHAMESRGRRPREEATAYEPITYGEVGALTDAIVDYPDADYTAPPFIRLLRGIAHAHYNDDNIGVETIIIAATQRAYFKTPDFDHAYETFAKKGAEK
jgi:hypothetical protein